MRCAMSSTSRVALSDHVAHPVGAQQMVAWASARGVSLVLMLGEQERRDRFGYALQEALRATGTSERELAKRMGIDPRTIAKWRNGKGLPDYYQTIALAETLGVKEDLFRNPPPVPEPVTYPIRDYLIRPEVAQHQSELVREAEALALADLEKEAGQRRAAEGERAATRRKRPA